MSRDPSLATVETPAPRRGKLPAHARQAHLLQLLRNSGSLQVTDVASELGVSDMTIRRDLLELERDGRATRVYGGALAGSPPPPPLDGDEPSFDSRLQRERPAKEAIALAAARLVQDQRTIALDVGTTAFLMCRNLAASSHAKVFTNNLRAATLLAGRGTPVYVAGGQIRPDEMAVVGPSAVAQFDQLWFDVAVIGVSGVTERGFFDYSLEEADMKRVYLTRSNRRIVLCDATKFRRMSLVQVGELSEATTLVTDAAPPADLAEAFAAAGVEIVVARPG